MNLQSPPKLIALAGGSGAGKSWLAEQLGREFGDAATTLSLDDFYCDLAHLNLSEREKINFDHPDAIDWTLFESVLRALQTGERVLSPRYDFGSHTRLRSGEWRQARPFIFVEGLWLLWPPRLRGLFDLRVFLDCSESLRWQRRLVRDLNERGRTADAICEQFWNVVAPMHEHFVKVQKAWADRVIEQPINQTELDDLITTIHALQTEPEPAPWTNAGARTTTPQFAALPSL